MARKATFILYCAAVVCMAAATAAESILGAEFSRASIYGAWWFALLWAALAAAGALYFISRKARRASVVSLHVSFAVILAGALLTRVSAQKGFMHLRIGDKVSTFYVTDGGGGIREARLPFAVELTAFNIKYHPGTETASDYESRIRVTCGGEEREGAVSMNNIYTCRSYRMYQSSYDPDLRGSVLAVNRDPAGIPVTYAGYALLLFSLIWALCDPKGEFRALLRSGAFGKGALALAAFLPAQSSAAALTLPKEAAEEFGRLHILYNGRICPVQTFAIDFTRRLCGETSYKGRTAEQVLAGFVFFADEWSGEPVIRLKGGALRDSLKLPGRVPADSFFDKETGGCILGPYLQAYCNGRRDAACRQAAEAERLLELIADAGGGAGLRLFPVTLRGRTEWLSSSGGAPPLADTLQAGFIANVIRYVGQEAREGRTAEAAAALGRIRAYQEKHAGASLPSGLQTRAERLYNALPAASALFAADTALGLLCLLLHVRSAARGRPSALRPAADALAAAALCLSLLALTFVLALRWVITGSAPMANGYEAMLSVAWMSSAAALALRRKARITAAFGLLMSGLSLLAARAGQADPSIGHAMPALSSPLLCVHVSVIMAAYALLSFTFVCGIAALAVHYCARRRGADAAGRVKALQELSLLMLHPAMAALAAGILAGSVWANISWGAYWSWDPKETWALITFMVYAAALHRRSVPRLARPLAWHAYMVCAFLSILMTYFGVNFLLGGMHSYA